MCACGGSRGEGVAGSRGDEIEVISQGEGGMYGPGDSVGGRHGGVTCVVTPKARIHSRLFGGPRPRVEIVVASVGFGREGEFGSFLSFPVLWGPAASSCRFLEPYGDACGMGWSRGRCDASLSCPLFSRVVIVTASLYVFMCMVVSCVFLRVVIATSSLYVFVCMVVCCASLSLSRLRVVRGRPLVCPLPTRTLAPLYRRVWFLSVA